MQFKTNYKMKNFTSVYDINNLQEIIAKALKIKENPLENPTEGKGKTNWFWFPLIPALEQD